MRVCPYCHQESKSNAYCTVCGRRFVNPTFFLLAALVFGAAGVYYAWVSPKAQAIGGFSVGWIFLIFAAYFILRYAISRRSAK